MIRRIILISFLIGFPFSIFSQCLLLSTTIDQRVDESNLVIEGKIIATTPFRGEKVNLIYTNYEIEVFRIFKGDISTETIEMVSVGGKLGDEIVVATPSFEGRIGQVGIFMLTTYKGNVIDNSRPNLLVGVAENASIINYHPFQQSIRDVFGEIFDTRVKLYQRIAGITHQNDIIKIVPTAQKGSLLVPSITSFTPTTVTAGTETLLTITGTAFGAAAGTVFFDHPNDGSGGSYTGSTSFHIQSWTDTEIEVWVPSESGTGGIFVRDSGGGQSGLSSDLTVTYNVSNINSGGSSFRTYFIDDACNGDGGYKFLYSTSTISSGVNFVTESSGAAKDAFERALGSWQTNGFSGFAGVDCGTTTIQLPSNDGTNLVSFDNASNPLGGSTLGVGYSQFSRCGSSEWELVGIDIIFRRDGTGVTWEYGPALPSGGESDFETVALHELGHNHQLGHVINNGALMHYSITTGTSNRTLGTEDIAGGNDVETVSVNYSPPLINCGTGNDFNCSRDYEVYAVANDCANSGLPIQLLSFTGNQQNKSTLLNWKTASEENNDFFTLEHSTDGYDFKFLTAVDGKGNSSITNDYRYIHKDPMAGINYYRLSQTDFDGTFKVENIIAVDFKSDQVVATVIPNPIRQNEINLNYISPQNSDLEVEVIEMTGKVLIQITISVSEGENNIQLPAQNWASGVYYLRTIQNQTIKSIKLVKTN
jgi:hypothetical protein